MRKPHFLTNMDRKRRVFIQKRKNNIRQIWYPLLTEKGRYYLYHTLKRELELTKNYLKSEISKKISQFARWVSHVGDGPLYVLMVLFFLINGNYSIGLNYSFGYLLAGLTFVFVKKGTKRSRPFNKDKEIVPFKVPLDEYSFPSGHSTMAFLTASITASYFPYWGIFAYLLALLIGLSRFALGVHYLTDIFCGAIIGYTIGKIVTLFFI